MPAMVQIFLKNLATAMTETPLPSLVAARSLGVVFFPPLTEDHLGLIRKSACSTAATSCEEVHFGPVVPTGNLPLMPQQARTLCCPRLPAVAWSHLASGGAIRAAHW